MLCGPERLQEGAYGSHSRFDPVRVCKGLLFEVALLLDTDDLVVVRRHCRVLYENRAPDEDAHTCYENKYAGGAIVAVRPDLWVGTSVFLGDFYAFDRYLEDWLLPVSQGIEGRLPLIITRRMV